MRGMEEDNAIRKAAKYMGIGTGRTKFCSERNLGGSKAFIQALHARVKSLRCMCAILRT